jgi:cell wall-associated NlpC family hydrolase
VRARIVQVAKKQVGDRYSAGSSGPSAFDCSGLTRYVYKVATGKELPHHSRSQYAKVKKVSRKNAKPGDLVFFFGGGAHHVGIYIGSGKMVDAAGYGKGVRVSPISGSWWSRTYSGIGRILPA